MYDDDATVDDDAIVDEDTWQEYATQSTLDPKRKLSVKHLPQLVGTVVVSSFTEKFLNAGHNLTLVPAMMMDTKSLYVAMYDCVHDLLLISEKIDYTLWDGRISMTTLYCCCS